MEMNFLINVYCFALMGPGFSTMSSSDGKYNTTERMMDSITRADDGSLVSKQTWLIAL